MIATSVPEKGIEHDRKNGTSSGKKSRLLSLQKMWKKINVFGPAVKNNRSPKLLKR